MKIAFFTDSWLPTRDGVVTSVVNTKRELERLGHDVVVFAPEDRSNGHDLAGDIVYARAREFRHYPGYRLAMFPGRETDQVKELGVDLIHSHGVGPMGLKGMWAAWQAKIPMVLTFHTMILDAMAYYTPFRLKLNLLERGLRLYLRCYLHKCGGVVVPTRAIAREIFSLAPRVRIADVIPTGVDPAVFHPQVSGASVRNRWGLDGQDLILHVGRVSPEKNLRLIIDALPLIRRSRPGAKLMVVGSGPYLETYRRYVRKRGLEGDVLFAGFVPDEELPGYYAACDAFAIASKFETQGLVVLEAMATGRPVAGANYRAIPEFVEDGRNGYLFDPHDVGDCADAVVGCLDSRNGMRREARRTAERFDIGRCAGDLAALYERLCAN
jgi:1,2-diacylglycerol 3-alpha-glucosyltransferase